MQVNLETVFSECRDVLDHPVVALETGCSFLWDEKYLPYISTYNILKHLVVPTNGVLYSLELDPVKMEFCKWNVDRLGFSKYFRPIMGDSVGSINDIKGQLINFVWLDSSEDNDHAFNEYMAVRPILSEKHVMCVDDYGCVNSVKWQTVSNIIKSTYTSHKTYETPTGLIVGRKEGK